MESPPRLAGSGRRALSLLVTQRMLDTEGSSVERNNEGKSFLYALYEDTKIYVGGFLLCHGSGNGVNCD